MIFKNEESSFRQRGFVCHKCDMHTIVYGQDPEPTTCKTCAQPTLSKVWDNVVSNKVSVVPYKDFVQAQAEGEL